MPDTAQPQLDQTLVGLSFEDGFRATEFLTATARLAASGYLRIIDAVIVTKDEQGKTTVRETTDLQIGESALSGALWACSAWSLAVRSDGSPAWRSERGQAL